MTQSKVMSTVNNAPQTLFRCQNARLVKHLPTQVSRVNGATPKDPLDAFGRQTSRDVILADWYGALYVDTVQDPFNSAISTLVFSIEPSASAAAQSSRFGAARRCVLPFRSFDVQADNSTTAQPLREVFTGLTAANGSPSFWFFEDASERGAEDRMRLEIEGRGKRAIWTCFLPVLVVKLMLARFVARLTIPYLLTLIAKFLHFKDSDKFYFHTLVSSPLKILSKLPRHGKQQRSKRKEYLRSESRSSSGTMQNMNLLRHATHPFRTRIR